MLPDKFTKIYEELLCEVLIEYLVDESKTCTELSIIGHVVCNDGQKGILVA